MILVTGGAGFIGSNLCEELINNQKEVICIDNFNNYYDPQIKENNIKQLKDNKNFILYRVDITNYEDLKKIFQKHQISTIVHLAARGGVRQSIKDPFIYEKVNINGTLNLLELTKEFKIKKFVFGSSSSVYGNNEKVPFSEEDKVDNQISPYAFTKRAGELLCQTYHNLYGISIVCLRFFTVYGPKGRPDMAVYKFIKTINEDKEIQIYGSEDSQRDYTYITDIVQGIMNTMDKDFEFEILNLGNSNPAKLKYLITLIEKNLNKKAKKKIIEKQQGDVDITFADISKTKKLIGYDPKTKIEEGIKNTVSWFLDMRA